MNVLVDVAFSQIQVLKLVHCFQDRSHFCEDDLGAVFASLQQLTDIDLNQNDYLTGSCLLLLSVKLKRLSIGKCFGIEHSYLRQMATKCTLISFFDFEQCHLADMDQVFAHWPLLRELKLSNFGTSMNVNVFQNLQQLVLFHFSHCRFTTNQLIAALSDSCPLLEDLDLSGYEIYDGETGAIDYRPLGRLQCLRHVDLSWHERMTDDDLGAIVCGGRLETLRLHLCCKLTSNGLIDAVDKCGDLRQLDVTGMDDSFQFVALSFLHVVSVVTDEQVYRRWPLQLTLDRKSRLQIAKCQQFCHHNLLVRLS
uniref:Uncharacterized protein n=1 Tax=Plectus sambesii TaxID=2011161 RepID=A0A914VA41_9BILA